MALYLKVSNSLQGLARTLCAELSARQNGVFQPWYIVTQTEGMNNWLKLQLAEHTGIAANYQFLKPNDSIYLIYQILGGRYAQPLSSDKLTWIFFKLLAGDDFIRRFGYVAAYYNQPGPDREVKRLALAENVADLFDQYQIYRPEMIRDWNHASAGQTGPDEWQKYLWIKAKELTGDRLPDRTLVSQYILQELKQPEQQRRLEELMPALHIFGLSVITSYHLGLYSELGKYTDFFFYILNPAPGQYWFEDMSEKRLAVMKKKGLAGADEQVLGNPLLTSWGRLIRNTFSLFFESDELINAYEETGSAEPDTGTLLQCIQHDIFHNSSPEERNRLASEHIADGSLVINACYTQVREVEVLYNYLVSLADRKSEPLSARDIVVMVSDIDAYAPYIRAVFNNAPYKFSYTIADESFTETDTLTNALQSVLRINRLNFKAEEVLQLLDSAYIRKRFGISDLSLIRKVTGMAGIRFGIDGDPADDTVYVSWKYGLQRIMYGICMSGDEEYMYQDEGFYPLDIVEGHASAEVIRFCHFVQVLISSVEERDRDRTVPEWVMYIEAVLRNLVFEPDEDTDDDYELLLRQLEKYNDTEGLLTEPVSYEVFIHNFLKTITSVVRAGTFATGGITFCSLIPMRSIPFKVVALLGLNFDKFPRKETPSGFSLMEKERKKGDRNMKENDKHLFLETLLSARKYLYISYIGQSVKDNTHLPPSALVDELIDYIESGAEQPAGVRSLLVTRHPLHGFSRKYQQDDPRLYSYLNSPQSRSAALPEAAKEPSPEFAEIGLSAFISFFKNPFKGYYNRVLGIYYDEEELLLPDTEAFELDSFSRWKLKQELLMAEPEHTAALKDKLIKTGRLPLKNMAGISLQSVEEEVTAIRELFRTSVNGFAEEHATIGLRVGPALLKGEIGGVYGKNIVCVSWSKSETKYLLEAYIRYLVAVAAGCADGLYFISAQKAKAFKAFPLPPQEALNRLEELMELFVQGHRQVLAFYPGFSVEPAALLQLTEEAFKKKVEDKLNNQQYPCTDAYLLKEYHHGFFSRQEVFAEYRSVAAKLLMPLTEFLPDYFK